MKKFICLLLTVVMVGSVSIGANAGGIQLIGKKYTFGNYLCGCSTQEFGEFIYVGTCWLSRSSSKKSILIKYTRDGSEISRAKLEKSIHCVKANRAVGHAKAFDSLQWKKKYTTRFHYSAK